MLIIRNFNLISVQSWTYLVIVQRREVPLSFGKNRRNSVENSGISNEIQLFLFLIFNFAWSLTEYSVMVAAKNYFATGFKPFYIWSTARIDCSYGMSRLIGFDDWFLHQLAVPAWTRAQAIANAHTYGNTRSCTHASNCTRSDERKCTCI